jgi:hypothetical protein
MNHAYAVWTNGEGIHAAMMALIRFGLAAGTSNVRNDLIDEPPNPFGGLWRVAFEARADGMSDVRIEPRYSQIDRAVRMQRDMRGFSCSEQLVLQYLVIA